MKTDDCAGKLKWFAEHACREESPLYQHLCSHAAADERLIEIIKDTPEGQPVPNLFLAAIHYLLLSESDHELAAFYPSCVGNSKSPQTAFPAFRDFCLANQPAIKDLMSRRRVQTNEVRRCAYLLPAFSYIVRRMGSRPLALIEVGSSAGLNLIWDRYAYDYGTGEVYGPSGAPGEAWLIFSVERY